MINSDDPIERIESKLDLIMEMLLDDEETELELPEGFSLDNPPPDSDNDIQTL